MIASLVFATFMCVLTPDNTDTCEIAYLQTWESSQDYRKDQEDCKAEVAALFPGDGVKVNSVTGKYQFGGCYRVMPGKWVDQSPDVVYLQNVIDADDSFTDYRQKLTVE